MAYNPNKTAEWNALNPNAGGVSDRFARALTSDNNKQNLQENLAGLNDKQLSSAVSQNRELGSMAGITVNDPIQADKLPSAKPLNIPQQQNSTTAQGISGVATGVRESTQSQIQQELDNEKAIREAELKSNKGSIESIREKLFGVRASQAQVEADAKLPEKQQKVTDVTNQLEASERAQINEIRALEGSGLTDVQKSAKTREINRQYAFEQADLALIQSAANRDLLTAQSIADRKIKLQLEPLLEDLEFAKFFYQENKEMFSKAEDRAFQNKIKELDRTYESEKSAAELIQKTKLQLLQSAASQGASAEVLAGIQKAGSAEEAISAAGQYGGDILERQIKQAQLQKALNDAKSGNGSNGKPLTTAQETALSYANRVNDANQILGTLESKFTGAGSYLGQLLPNKLKTDERQQFEQAQRNFVNAVLRRESGAAIAPSEFESAARQYFPQPGDKEGVIEQKRANRDRTLSNLLREGGQEVNPVKSSQVYTANGVRYVQADDGLFYPEK